MRTLRLLSRAAGAALVASAFVACGLDAVGTRPDPAGADPTNDGSVAVPPGADRDATPADGGLPTTDASDASDASDDGVAGLDPDAAFDGAADADADADAGPTTAVGVTTVDPTSRTVDLVSPGDGAIAANGQDDGVFRVDVTGPLVALTLIRTDAAGTPAGSQQWDTWVGADVIPAQLGGAFAVGSLTYQLGVFGLDGTLLNDAAGRLTLAAGAHSLRVAGADVGSFVAGTHFRVVAARPDGTLVRGPVVTY
jgi:hypothetical protein